MNAITTSHKGPEACANCAAKAVGDCPRCYDETGDGCPHGELCEWCAEDARQQPLEPNAKQVPSQEKARNEDNHHNFVKGELARNGRTSSCCGASLRECSGAFDTEIEDCGQLHCGACCMVVE